MDVEGIERATLAGVAPPKVSEISGWLAAFDRGTIRRAHSAVPLHHSVGAVAIDALEAAYRAENLPPAFRVAEAAGLEGVRRSLEARGYSAVQPTVVELGDPATLAAFSRDPAELLAAPDEAWAAVYQGEGFDPVDGAHRVAALSRAKDALYGAVREDGRIVAVGVVAFGQGWAGIHGMRTAGDRRGKGYAGRILSEFGRAIAARGISQIFLQVEEANPARSLYRKAGFSPAWTYRYWS